MERKASQRKWITHTSLQIRVIGEHKLLDEDRRSGRRRRRETDQVNTV